MSVFAVLGWLAVVAASVAVCMTVFDAILDKFGRLSELWLRDAKANGVKEAGRHLAACSYWFSEDPAAMAAIKAAGEDMAANGRVDVSAARDEWRKSIKPRCRPPFVPAMTDAVISE